MPWDFCQPLPAYSSLFLKNPSELQEESGPNILGYKTAKKPYETYSPGGEKNLN